MQDVSLPSSQWATYRLERQGAEAIALIGMNHAAVNSFRLGRVLTPESRLRASMREWRRLARFI